MDNAFKLEDFLPYRLNVLAQRVSEQLSVNYAGKFGLDVPQWRILANLASRGAMTAQDIAALTFSHKSTISRAVQQLEDRGLIRRSVSGADRRSFALSLTAEGKKFFRQLLPPVLEFERNLLSKIGGKERLALLKGLSALEQALHPGRGEQA